MKPEHEYAQVLRWIADGERIQSFDGTLNKWIDRTLSGPLMDIFNEKISPEEFRIKPRTININGIEVPEPVRVALNMDQDYWMPSTGALTYDGVTSQVWLDTSVDHARLQYGLIHLTKEAAKLHARAIFSITEVKE